MVLFIKYGGVEYVQVRNAVHCKLCKDTIQSNHSRDFKMCICGSIGIDGGIEPGNRIIGDLENIESRCMYRAYVGKKLIWLPQHIDETIFALQAKQRQQQLNQNQ
jgi:hypothetical protein